LKNEFGFGWEEHDWFSFNFMLERMFICPDTSVGQGTKIFLCIKVASQIRAAV